jgi:hypothetical protein
MPIPGEVSRRMARVGETFISFLTVRVGLRANRMRREMAARRRRKRLKLRLRLNLFRISLNWKKVKTTPRPKRIRITHRGKMGAMMTWFGFTCFAASG